MTFILGLTGSIAMGKTTAARMFRAEGIEVWDADAAVHRLYKPRGDAVGPVSLLFPETLSKDGGIDRDKLRALIAENPSRLDELNSIVHPLVAADRARFLSSVSGDIVVLDIPLLFETGADNLCDAVAVVSAPEELQRQRLAARGLEEEAIALLRARQLPDAEKRARADFLIDSSSLETARTDVRRIIQAIREGKVPCRARNRSGHRDHRA